MSNLNTKTEIPEKTTGDCPWTIFSAAKGDWLRAASEKTDSDSENEGSLDREQAQAQHLVDYFLAALSPSPERSIDKGRDLDVMKKALSSIYEAVEEDILTESEASALVQFIVSKFIERRFNVILRNVFDVETYHRYTFRGVRGKIR